MNMKEKNAKKSRLCQLGFSFLKRESNYLDRQRQSYPCVFLRDALFGHPSHPGFSGVADPFKCLASFSDCRVILLRLAYLFRENPNGEGNRLYRYRHPVLYRS